MMADPFASLGFAEIQTQNDKDPFASLGFSEQKAPEQQVPTMSKFESAVTGFNTGAGNLAHGALQPLVESGLFGNRVRQGSKDYAAQRQQEFGRAKEANPITAELGNIVGGIAASTPLMAIPGAGQSALARGVTQGIAQGGLMGAGQYVNPGESRAENAALGGLLGGAAYPVVKGLSYPLGFLFGSKNTINRAGNKILDSLAKQSQKGGALTPQETAENLAANFTNIEGKPVPVDIGTVTNNPTLKKAYQALKFAPFSGASKNANITKTQLSDKAISEADKNIEAQAVRAQESEQALANQMDVIKSQKSKELSSLGAQSEKDRAKILGEINKRIANPEADKLKSQIDALIKEQNKYASAIDQAPSYLNKLVENVPDRSNVTGSLKKHVRDVYLDNKIMAAENYRPINESNVRLDVVDPENSFKNYRGSASELLAKRENLKNLFASDSDLGSKLNAELNKAESMLNAKDAYGITAKEAVQRIQNLGRLAASAKSQGNRYEGMLLDDLQNGLAKDTHDILNKTGNANLATALLKANEYYKNNVVPFWSNSEIRKAVTDKGYIPQQSKLAKALHDSNNQGILDKLSPEAKNMSLYQLMTGGKGTSSGMSNLTAEEIAKNYGSLPVDTKRAIASYHPEADKYFEGLTPAIKIKGQLVGAQEYVRQNLDNLQSMTNKEISVFQKNLEKIKSGEIKGGEKIKASESKSIEKLQGKLEKLKEKNEKEKAATIKALEDAKNKKYGISKDGGASSNFVENLAKTAAVGGGLLGGAISPLTLGLTIPAGLAARNTAKLLSSPELIQAYINSGRLPVTASKNTNRYLTSGLLGLTNGEKEK